MNDTITCPHCHKGFKPTEAYAHQIEERLKQAKEEGKQEVREISMKYKKELEEQMAAEKKSIEQEAKKKAQEDLELKLKNQANEADELKEAHKKLQEQMLELSKSNRTLQSENAAKQLELEKKLAEEQEKMRLEIRKQADEENYLKLEQERKKTSDALKQLAETKRKLEQGSQQTQGEVLELKVEQMLREEFPQDLIEEIAKGKNGADIRQTVRTPRGVTAGVILWETKEAKAWDAKWVTKLKDDLRAEKAHFPVIVTNIFPKDFSGEIGQKDGVLIVKYGHAIFISELLRRHLLALASQKDMASFNSSKTEQLFQVITGHGFKQQIEAMVEAQQEMKRQIERERASYARLWKAREQQADRLLFSLANIVGEIQGTIGQTALQVKGLDLLPEEIEVEIKVDVEVEETIEDRLF